FIPRATIRSNLTRTRTAGAFATTTSRSRSRSSRPSANEMARGASTYEVAAQRVVNAYGNTLPHEEFAKGATDIAVTFCKYADDFVDGDSTMPRTEALRAARLANPSLFRALQSAD